MNAISKKDAAYIRELEARLWRSIDTANQAAARIEALERALRVIIAEPDGCVSPAFKALAATALGPEKDK